MQIKCLSCLAELTSSPGVQSICSCGGLMLSTSVSQIAEEMDMPWNQLGYDPSKEWLWRESDEYDYEKYLTGAMYHGGPDELFILPKGVKLEYVGDLIMLQTVRHWTQAQVFRDPTKVNRMYAIRKNIN